MTENIEHVVQALVRSSMYLAIAAILAWLTLHALKIQSTRVHRFVWIIVLMQGLVLVTLRVEVPVSKVSPEHDSVEFPITQISPTSLLSSFERKLPSSTSPQLKELSSEVTATAAILRPHQSLFRAWIAGLLLTIAWQLQLYVKFLRTLDLGQPAPVLWQQEWDEACKAAGVSGRIRLTMTNHTGPVLCWSYSGYRLLLPQQEWSSLTAMQRESVLHHELAHYQRGDVWKGLVYQLAAAVHWFNPFAWLAVRRLAECAEWSCDASVQAAGRDRLPGYVKALMQFSLQRSHLPDAFPTAGGHSVVRRAKRLLTPDLRKDPRMKTFVVTIFVAVLATANLLNIQLVAQDKDPGKKQIDVQVGSLPREAESVGQSSNEAPTVHEDESEKSVLTTGANESRDPEADRSIPHILHYHPEEGLLSTSYPVQHSVTLLSRPMSPVKPDIESRQAVIDLAYVLKNLPEVQELRKTLLLKVRNEEKSMKDNQRLLLSLRNRLKQANSTDSLQSTHGILDEIKQLQASLHVETEQARRRIKQEEANLYAKAYRKVRAAIAAHAKEHGIQIVRRATTSREQQKKLDSGDPMAVIEAMNASVLYVASEDVDITDAVLKRVLEAE